MSNRKIITRTIWVLSLVSLFTDVASEMLYPIMPLYLKSIGFSVVLIGVLEGIAEATAGFSKGYFGKLSDNSGRRAPFVQIGYSLSTVAKPMMIVFVYPLWIFFARTIDRLGKGIRTGARDAMLSDESTPATKGRIFGFHRSMDTLGAVIGPSLALIYLWRFPGQYKPLFLVAFFPGILAVAMTFLIKDKNIKIKSNSARTGFFSFIKYWKESPDVYRKIVAGLLFFSLFNSSDVFLLLRIKQSGQSDTFVILVYIFYNIIFAASSFPLGILADKIGLRKTLVAGLILFSAVYFLISFDGGLLYLLAIFFLYGLYAAATDGISKALISNISDKKDTATAIGTFTGFQSICAMLASSLTGFLWYRFGASIALMVTACATALAAIYLSRVKIFPPVGKTVVRV